MIDDIPYGDKLRLLEWVEHHLTEVTPLILERLLTHHDFVQAGNMPTQAAVYCVVWKHKYAEHDPKYANARILVYHTEVVAERRVRSALQLLEVIRQLERRNALQGKTK